jgi:hypothetical protein
MQIAATLAETEAFILLPSDSTPASLPARRARAISVESDFESIECGSAANLSRGAAEESGRVAFHAFATEQRGEAISHRTCLDSMESFRASLGTAPADWLVTTLRPDLALSGMWMLTPLIYGARVILAPVREDVISELHLNQTERSRAVVLRATPAIATAALNAKWQVRARLKLVRGAEVWPDELLKTLDAIGVEVWQLHGTAANYRLHRDEASGDSAATRAAANGDQS